MAIRTSITVDDRMSGAFRSMSNALNVVINSFASLQNVADRSIDTASIETARAELANVGTTLNQVESEIQQANSQQQQFNNSLRGADSPAGNLLNKVKQIGVAIGGFMGVKKALDLSDSVAQTTARLNLMNDGLQTTEQLQEMIYQSAQRSRGAYADTANMVARLGIVAKDAFSSNAETIAFAEQLNKHFKIAGTNANEAAAVSLQLSQALGSGVLRGDELNSVFEQAPTVIQAIADYLQVPIGEIRDMAGDGEITASIVKNAMLAAAEETNKKFESIPKTFGDVATDIKNKALVMFQPALQKLNDLANSPQFDNFVNGVLNGLYAVSNVVIEVFNVVAGVGSFIYDNWSILAPVIIGVASALAMYGGYLAWTKGLETASAAIKIASCIASYAKAAATGAEVSATAAATAAQYGFNTALLACPITWIIIAIIALIAIFYAAVAAVNKFTGATVSGTGIICGVLTTAVAFIANLILGVINFVIGLGIELYNLIASFANFFANVFNDPVGAIKKLFFDLFDTIVGIVESAARMIDTLLNSNIGDKVAGFRAKVNAYVDTKVNTKDVMSKLNQGDYMLKGLDYKQAYNTGYKFGEGLDKKVSSVFDTTKLGLNDYGVDGLGGLGDLGNLGSNLDDIKDSSKKTAENTDTTKEDLQYLRDLADRETINRFTTAEIKVDMGGVSNTVNNMADLDGIADYLANKVEEQMQIAAEGVY